MSEDSKSNKTKPEDSKSSTTGPAVSDSEYGKDNAGDNKTSRDMTAIKLSFSFLKDSKSDTTDSASDDESKKEDSASDDESKKEDSASDDESKKEDSSSGTSEAKSLTEEEKKQVLKIVERGIKMMTCEAIYPAGFLKNGLIQGISYQLKLLTWTAWKLFSNKENENWELAAEAINARGFHDLVVKYNTKTNSKAEKSTTKYRFVQIKHTSSKRPIDKDHLSSTEKFDRQYSLIYLFTAYLDMLQSFKNDDIMDLTLFTNKGICAFPFLVPIEKDKIFSFKKKGKRYRIDIKALDRNSKIMKSLKKVKDDNAIIGNFLSKLVLAVDQPTEPELEELIISDMKDKLEFMAPIFYIYLFKNIFEWFLILYDFSVKKAPYYNEESIKKLFDVIHSTLGKVVDAAAENPLFDCLLS